MSEVSLEKFPMVWSLSCLKPGDRKSETQAMDRRPILLNYLSKVTSSFDHCNIGERNYLIIVIFYRIYGTIIFQNGSGTAENLIIARV